MAKLERKLSEDGLILIPFEHILTALLDSQTVFVKTDDGLLAIKFDKATSDLLGCTIDKNNYLILDNFKPIDLKLSELLCGYNLDWYRYITFNTL